MAKKFISCQGIKKGQMATLRRSAKQRRRRRRKLEIRRIEKKQRNQIIAKIFRTFQRKIGQLENYNFKDFKL